MSQQNKELIITIEAAALEEMLDDSAHQVEFSKFCLKYYLNAENEDINKITLLCENFSVNQKLHEFASKTLNDNPIDEETRMVILNDAGVFIMETLVLTKIALQADLKKFANISIEEN